MVRQTDLEIEDSATSNYIVRQIAFETEYSATVYIVRQTTIDRKYSTTVAYLWYVWRLLIVNAVLQWVWSDWLPVMDVMVLEKVELAGSRMVGGCLADWLRA